MPASAPRSSPFCSTRLASCLVVVVVMVAAGCALDAGPAQGVKRGDGLDAGAVRRYEAWLGRPMTYVHLAQSIRDWAAVESPFPHGWHTGRAGGRTVMLYMSMLPGSAHPGRPRPGTSLRACAANRGDAYGRRYARLATELVRRGQGRAVVRAGREFDGDWYPWTMVREGPEAYAGCFRTVVRAMRRAAPGLKFMWNPMFDFAGTAAERAYPSGHDAAGRDYVDYVGVDIYDGGYANGWGQLPDDAARTARWQRHQLPALQAAAAFARARHKPLSVPEWGLLLWQYRSGCPYVGGGDNPVFVRGMAAFLKNAGNVQHNPDPATNLVHDHAFWEDDGMGVADPDALRLAPGSCGGRTRVPVPRSRSAFCAEFGRHAGVCDGASARPEG